MAGRAEHLKYRVRPEPHRDESFTGYILRVADANSYTSAGRVLRTTGLEQLVRRKKFAARPDEILDLSKLERRLDIRAEKLSELTYEHSPDINVHNNYRLFRYPVLEYLIRPYQPKICPGCLRESNYCRKIWEFVPFTACPKHKILLIDECPKCRQRVSWSRTRVSTCTLLDETNQLCNCDWRDNTSAPVGECHLQASSLILAICGLGDDDGVPCKGPTKNPLYGTDLRTAVSALLLVAGHMKGMIDTTGKFLGPTMRNAEIHSLVSKASQIFEDWPERFYNWLDALRADSDRPRLNSGPRGDFGNSLYRWITSTSFPFMRDAFNDYLGRWDGGYTAHFTALNKTVRTDNRFMSRKEAQKTLQTDASRVEDYIKAGRLKAVIKQRGKGRIILIERSSVEKIHQERETSLGLKGVAHLLGINVRQVPGLIKYGCLVPADGPTVSGLRNWTIQTEEVNALLEKLRNSKNADRLSSEDVPTSFKHALNSLRSQRVKTGQFIKAIIDGDIAPVRELDGIGFNRFVFSKMEIRNYRRKLLEAS